MREEVEHYSKVYAKPEADPARLFEPAPESWCEILRRSDDYVRARTGADVTGHLVSRLRARPGVRLLSLGCGPGGVELMLSGEAPEAEIHGMDLNGALLAKGRANAAAGGHNVTFEQTDLNRVELPRAAYDIVFCHASLHHILELERVLDQVKQSLRGGGCLITVDIISRSGYRMWPETRRVAANIFRTLPEPFRLNHTAYPLKWVDEKIWEEDTRGKGMECARSEEILPLLRQRFHEQTFAGYQSLSRRFLNTMYGPNYDLSRPLDRAILDWIWELDCHYLETGELKPETFFGIYV
jgi:2-polyprenyl-3-methyl-5-hydroxy-6-metoxy-1,4-benzoquinol methylase